MLTRCHVPFDASVTHDTTSQQPVLREPRRAVHTVSHAARSVTPVIALLVNPAAGRGRAAAQAPRVEQALSELGRLRRFDTTGPGDERRLARAACEQGARVLAVVGGDGALHHAMRGLLDVGAPIPLAPFAAGTGNDFVKAIGLPAHDPVAMAACIARGHTRRVDIGFVDDVPFLNAAGFGFDVDVLRRMRTQRWLRGTAAYVSTALQALFGYRGFHVTRDGPPGAAPEERSLMLVCANGHCFGGAFRIAPSARVDDGALDVITIADVPPLARPGLFLRAVRGSHVHHAAVTHGRETSVALTFRAPPEFDADGEVYASTGARVVVSVRAGALTVVACP